MGYLWFLFYLLLALETTSPYSVLLLFLLLH